MTGILYLTILIGLILPVVQAAGWETRLQGGGAVRVDPESNRATVTRNGINVPLWDGVHKLDNGSTLTIRSGIAVPNKAILGARATRPVGPESVDWEGPEIVGDSPCEKLVHKTCGPLDQCLRTWECRPARQLLATERRERQASQHPERMTFSSLQCQNATEDGTFYPPCETDTPTGAEKDGRKPD